MRSLVWVCVCMAGGLYSVGGACRWCGPASFVAYVYSLKYKRGGDEQTQVWGYLGSSAVTALPRENGACALSAGEVWASLVCHGRCS